MSPMGETIRLNPEELTIGDLEDFEEIVGRPFADVFPQGQGEVMMDAKALKALVFISKRKDDPAFTLDDARNVRVATLDMTTADPTGAAG